MIILKNGILVDPKTNFIGKKDIAINGELIQKIADNIQTTDEDEVYDCSGKYVGPGLVDIHVHFRDPGFTYKEDIQTGTKAAAAGGFTTVILMANTKPAVDSKETLDYIIGEGNKTDINVYTCANITRGMQGNVVNDFKELLSYGAIGFTDDGVPLLKEEIVREAMQRAAETDSVLSFHEENPDFITNNGVNRGKASEFYGIGGSDRQAEISMVERDLKLAQETGAKVNFQHLSTKEAVDLIREAKKAENGDKIYAEATPHHMILTETAVIEHGTLAKMNPPLRTEEDRKAIIKGLMDGTIDIIATDHAPHSEEEKNKKITEAPSGITGLETSMAIAYKTLVMEEKMTVLQLFCKMSYNPANIYKLKAGFLAENSAADLVIFDPNQEWKYEKTYSKSKNSPFFGEKFKGKVQMTLCKGKIVYNDMN